jgi:cytidine deaminase
MKPTNQQIFTQLLQQARHVAEKAYAPYSKFKVGAALLTEDDEIFTGCNVENASYGLTLCAERNAIASMVAAGHNKFKAIAIYTEKKSNCYPCGACRQWLYEFGPEATVIVEDEKGEKLLLTVTDLLPHAFGPEDLL